MKKNFNPIKTLAFKYSEMVEIRDRYAPEFELPAKFEDYCGLKKYKNKLYQYIRGESYKKIKNPVTHIGTEVEVWYGTRLSYVYARQGLLVLDPFQSIYNLGEDVKSNDLQAYFTSCCQAATWSVIYSLLIGYEISNFERINRLFFETVDVIKFLSPEFVNDFGIRVVFLDSSSAGFKYPDEIKDDEIFFLDTTCIFRGNVEFEEFVKKSIKNNWKVILVRSHLKIDCNGAEYGLLGSVVLINPGKFPELNLRLNFTEKPKSFEKLLQRVASIHSKFCGIESVYPFLSDSRFGEMTKGKEKRILKNYQEIVKYIEENGEKINIYKHGLFFTFETGCYHNHIEQFHRDKADYLHGVKEKTGFPVYFSDSYGFDFFTVTAYLDYNADSNYLTCRISITDMEAEDFLAGRQILLDIVKTFKKKPLYG